MTLHVASRSPGLASLERSNDLLGSLIAGPWPLVVMVIAMTRRGQRLLGTPSAGRNSHGPTR
jgi:hypothetical protein